MSLYPMNTPRSPMPGTAVYSNGTPVQFCAECLLVRQSPPRQPVTTFKGDALCIEHFDRRVTSLKTRGLTEDEVRELVIVVREAYADRHKSDDTVNVMIAQGIRSAYIRGQNSQVLHAL